MRQLPEPSQTYAPHSLSGSVPESLKLHVPAGGALHRRHCPEHAESQQKPSTQLPLWHSFAALQVCPFERFASHVAGETSWLQKAPILQSVSPVHGERQANELVQYVSPHSFSGSVRVAYGLQMPSEPARLQLWHRPEHALLQHRPSAQWPDWHWSAAVQLWPFG